MENFLWMFIIVILLIEGCIKNKHSGNNKGPRQDLPALIDTLKNVDIYSIDKQPYDTVTFERIRTFGSNKGVYLNGYIFKLAVDSKNRVYLYAGKPNTAQAVYVFKPDGHFITKIGRIGKGPGEFLAITYMKIRNQKLYVYDSLQHKMSIFSLTNFKLIDNFKIRINSLGDDKQLNFSGGMRSFFIVRGGTYLAGFVFNLRSNENRKILYHRISDNGEIKRQSILEVKPSWIYDATMTNLALGFAMPFSPNTIVAVAKDDTIFTTWNSSFLIKVYSPAGTYQRAFYYPIEKVQVNLNQIPKYKLRKRFIETHHKPIPDNWPVIHTMFFDDKNRLWVFIITKSDSTYMGWILNKKGELLARFKWPGKRYRRITGLKPLMIVKNGFFYTLERDLDKGIDRIVKWKIKFSEQQ